MVDEPLKFQGGLTKRSYFNKDGRVTINDKEDLCIHQTFICLKQP